MRKIDTEVLQLNGLGQKVTEGPETSPAASDTKTNGTGAKERARANLDNLPKRDTPLQHAYFVNHEDPYMQGEADRFKKGAQQHCLANDWVERSSKIGTYFTPTTPPHHRKHLYLGENPTPSVTRRARGALSAWGAPFLSPAVWGSPISISFNH